MPVEYRDADGAVRTTQVWLIDFDNPDNNDWLAVNQFTIVEDGKNRRPDVLVFVNGLPLGLLELKNPADEHATLKSAWNQIQTYRSDIPSIFTPNAVTVISDGTSAAMSSFSGGFEHYAPWKTIDGREVVTDLPALEVLIKGVFDQARFLDLLRNFVVFSDETSDKTGRGAGSSSGSRSTTSTGRSTRPSSPPSRPPVRTATGAVASSGTRRARARAIEMLFYAAKIMRDPRMSNPTLVFLTDRNDLDDQLFGEVFAPAAILPETPVQADYPRRPARPAAPGVAAASSSRRCRSSRPRRGRRRATPC